MADLPLSTLFKRALDSASKSVDLPTIADETQELIQSSVDDLLTLRSRVTELALFSPNESLGDISTKDLIYVFVPYATAQVQNRKRITDREDRVHQIHNVLSCYQAFQMMMDAYKVVPEAEKQIYSKQASSINDPAKRRELKIKQYQKEKELKTRIEALRKRRNQSPLDKEPSNDFDFVISVLPLSSPETPSKPEEDSETEDAVREAILVLLRLFYAQTHGEIDGLQQELELLKNAPPEPPKPPSNDPRQGKKRQQEEDMWRLDAPRPMGGPDGKGPLLDSSGKARSQLEITSPLRPFTILPSNAADRARLQAEVFRPDHRLPTMSIDEYLEIEQQRGNIISGGGPASEAKLTTSEQLQLDSEMDGTTFGEDKAEEKRQKDEKWAQYTDANPKGAGNTMNRG